MQLKIKTFSAFLCLSDFHFVSELNARHQTTNYREIKTILAAYFGYFNCAHSTHFNKSGTLD